MAQVPLPLTTLSEAQRAQALQRYTIIRPALEKEISQALVARTRQLAPQKSPRLAASIHRQVVAIANEQGWKSPRTALTTALALRQAVWRKEDPRWHASGIPTVFYTNYYTDLFGEFSRIFTKSVVMLALTFCLYFSSSL